MKELKSKNRWGESLFILSIVFSVFFLLALFSYDSHDSVWSAVNLKSTSYANLCGKIGAYLADFAFSFFGILAYIIPFFIPFLVGNVTLADKESKSRLIHFSEQCFLFLLLISAFCILAEILLPQKTFFNFLSGGIVGLVLTQKGLLYFSNFSLSLISIGVILVVLTIMTDLSWIKLSEVIGENIWLLLVKIFRKKKIEGRNKEKIENVPIDEDVFAQKTSSKPEKIPEKNKNISIKRAIFDAPLEHKIPREHSDTLPSLDLLEDAEVVKDKSPNEKYLESLSEKIESSLKDFGVLAKVTEVETGPVITRFELSLHAGTKGSRISALAKDLARSLAISSVRVVEVIEGKSVIGLEIPNEKRATIRLKEILASDQYQNSHASLSVVLGKDTRGEPVVVDLAKMPHLLVAGTTGSGKSVGLNAMILSLLYRYSPDNLRMLLIDPKMLELSVYDGIPHLLTPVVTDMKDTTCALRWCVMEMERRYKVMAFMGVRNIIGYNLKIEEAQAKNEPVLDPLWQEGMPEDKKYLQKFPYIIVLADEFADMMMVIGKKVEELITRIAQKARAAGIHLILATQRPSVDVITGLIKANIPSRVAFQVSSRIDSRTILDQMGAEQLLGNGDMLYLPPGTSIPIRVHGAFVSDEEVHNVVEFIKKNSNTNYIEEILSTENPIPGIDKEANSSEDSEEDPLYDEAVSFVFENKKVSVSSIQRRFKIGYNRASRIVEAMEKAGLVSSMDRSGNRELLVKND